MSKARPIYKRLLIAAIVIYIIASSIMLADIYYKVGTLKHKVFHITGNTECSF